MYMKKYIFLAASALTLASCSSDDFLGDTPGSTPTSANSAIKFDGNAGKISRATSNTDPTTQGKLDYQFKIYGVKKVDDNKYSKVFEDYNIWWNTTKTASNTNDWEYVADKGTISTGETATKTNIELSKKQTIKYWDYASEDYHFVAGSPISAFTYNIKTETGDIESATIKNLRGHITATEKEEGTEDAKEPNPVYVANPVVVHSNDYKKPVTFNFVRHQTKVRVGIYETIPGYSVTNIKFYKYADGANELSVDNDNNIILTSATTGYFKGGSSVSGKINYVWSKATPEYTFEYEATGLTESKNWYGGKFANGIPAKISTETDKTKLYGTDAEMESQGYFTVLPTPSETEIKSILIKCDYTLKSDDGSEETIKVKGATAAIPAAYSKWNTNTLYTYIFKISENTNGYTGTEADKTGLYPITFDAAVEAPQFGMQGTITTFTTPSITTYQANSVTDDGIKYVANKDIEVTVTESTSGTIKNLSTGGTSEGNVSIYMFTKDITEAEMQILGPNSGTAVNCTANSNKVTFTPEKAGWYVIQYLAKAKEGTTPAVYTYKVVKVVAAPATK